jgi:AmmeMemoRadiSam system protein B
VRHDAAFLDALERELGEDLSEGHRAHRAEHSVEFQALWLAHLWPDDPPAIVPLLLGSFHDLMADGGTPAGDPEVEAFIRALRDVRARDPRRVVVLASVDLAHLGPMYDQPEGLDDAGEQTMERDDRALLAHIAAGDAEAFFRTVGADGNARNVCGVAPLYVTLRIGGGAGELLRYGQGRIHPESGSVVSFAAMAFPK